MLKKLAINACWLSLWGVSGASAVDGRQHCFARDEIFTNLKGTYGETVSAFGLTNQGVLVEVLTSDDGKTWTIFATTADMVSCFVASGRDWRSSVPKQTPERIKMEVRL